MEDARYTALVSGTGADDGEGKDSKDGNNNHRQKAAAVEEDGMTKTTGSDECYDVVSTEEEHDAAYHCYCRQ